MVENILKGIGVVLLIYILWLATGGVERGEERRAMDEDGLFVEIRGTSLSATSTDGLFDR